MKLKILYILLLINSFLMAQKEYLPVPFDTLLYEGKQEYLQSVRETPSSKLNVIFIVADDLGKYDLSLYGNPYIKTPNIDELGNNGLVFNTGYATAAVCSPSRAGLLTGRYQQRFGYHVQPHQRYPKSKFELWAFRNLINTGDLKPEKYTAYPSQEERMKMGLPSSEITIAEMLKTNGYRTALIGKWHLGYNEPLLPRNFGFDYRYGFNEAYSLFADPKDKNIVNAPIKEFTDKIIWKGGREGACAIFENETEVEEKEYLTYAFFNKAKEFIGKNKEQPFFVFLPINAPHTPYQAPKDIYDELSHIEEHNRRVYYAMVVALDNAVGELVSFLKNTDQYENTLIIFTSDNGAALYSGTVDNKPLNAGKFTLFEGGVTVPFIIHSSQLIRQPRRISQPASLLDVFPTIADVTQSQLPKDRILDGVSLRPYFEGDTIATQLEREAIYWYSDYNSAIRVGDYKLILNELDNTVDLYNLKSDPYELNNLSSQVEEVEKLKNQLDLWRALMPRMYWPRIMNYEVEINGKLYRWAV